VRKIKSRTAARQARRKPRTTRRKPHQHQLASASLTTGAPDGAPANFGLVHVLKAEPLVTESPAIGERTVHHLEAGSNRLKPAQPQHPTPQRDAADLVLARIYLDRGQTFHRGIPAPGYRRAVEQAELNPGEITCYALRHSSIVRALLGGVPVAVAAQQHDTSVREIEAHYAAYILDHSDALSRRALLDTAQTVAPDLVVRPAKPHAAVPGMHCSTTQEGLHHER
jgi:hypothetical protein